MSGITIPVVRIESAKLAKLLGCVAAEGIKVKIATAVFVTETKEILVWPLIEGAMGSETIY